MDRVGFEPTTSAMPMPYPTGLDDRPSNNSRFWNDIKMIRLLPVQMEYKNNNNMKSPLVARMHSPPLSLVSATTSFSVCCLQKFSWIEFMIR
jgi:hypothetical protein